jgi:LmbE family N-acetylglucosaminyl deacetylase
MIVGRNPDSGEQEGLMENSRRTLMEVFAHPDDEVFGSGGTTALESERGTRVVLVVATGGEAGEVVNPELRGSVDLADLPRIRQEELACSARALSIDEVVKLGYRDSGMAGTSENQRPEAFMNADVDEVTGRLVRLIRHYRPQVLLTFDQTGGYGHPDHLMVHRATHLAFLRAGDTFWYADAGPVWQPARLFHVSIVREQLQAVRDDLVRRDIPLQSGFETMTEEEFTNLGTGRDEVTTVVDISSTVSRKLAAFRCYETQTPTDFFYLQVSEDVLGEEFFTLAATSVDGPPPEHDLFERLNVGE